jgi:hypothetical protein
MSLKSSNICQETINTTPPPRVNTITTQPWTGLVKSKTNNMNFGQAIEALKEGKKVAREGWNGKGMFLILNGGYSVPKEASKPDNHINEAFLEKEGQTHLHIGKHIDMWTAQKNLCVGWLASQTDMLAEDWIIVE